MSSGEDTKILIQINKSVGELKGISDAHKDWTKSLTGNIEKLTDSFNDHVNESEMFRAKVKELKGDVKTLKEFKDSTNRRHNIIHGILISIIAYTQVPIGKIGSSFLHIFK